eukprot:803936-Prorocentrum_minimum.AAC.5
MGPKKWSVIAQQLPGRIGKQCRERSQVRKETISKKLRGVGLNIGPAPVQLHCLTFAVSLGSFLDAVEAALPRV